VAARFALSLSLSRRTNMKSRTGEKFHFFFFFERKRREVKSGEGLM
jgi:hypothetical protein